MNASDKVLLTKLISTAGTNDLLVSRINAINETGSDSAKVALAQVQKFVAKKADYLVIAIRQ